MKGRDDYDDGFSERLKELELLEERERNEPPKARPPKKQDKCIHDILEEDMEENEGLSDIWTEYQDDPEPYPDIGEEYQDDKERWDNDH